MQSEGQPLPRKSYLDESQTGYFCGAKNRTFSLCLDRFKFILDKSDYLSYIMIGIDNK